MRPCSSQRQQREIILHQLTAPPQHKMNSPKSLSSRRLISRDKRVVTVVVGITAIAILATLVVSTALPNTSRFMHVLHKTGHPLIFGIIALLALSLLGQFDTLVKRPSVIRYVVAFAIAVLVGAMTEVGQLFTHRGASAVDVQSDAVGAIAWLAWYAALFQGRELAKRTRWRLSLGALALAASTIAVGPLIWCLAAYAVRDAHFPIMLKDPSVLEMYFVAANSGEVSLATLPGAADASERVVKVPIDRGLYPGMQIIEPFPRWSGHRTLAVDVTNPGEAGLELVVRVQDRQHSGAYDDRFNRNVIVAAKTRTTILVPLHDVEHGPKQRSLDLDAVANLNIFAVRAVAGGEFLVSGVWLQ